MSILKLWTGLIMSSIKGRPSRIFETEKIEEFLKLIQDGVDFNIAADSSRLARSTIFEWLKKGREIQETHDESVKLSKSEQALLDFLERFMRARVAPEVKAVEVINTSIEKGSWRAAAWVLEHRFPDRWSVVKEPKNLSGQVDTSDSALQARIEAKVMAVLGRGDQHD
jgi:hypothetical protein